MYPHTVCAACPHDMRYNYDEGMVYLVMANTHYINEYTHCKCCIQIIEGTFVALNRRYNLSTPAGSSWRSIQV